MKKQNPHIGSSFESWLDEQGLREEATAAALKSVLSLQIAAAMKDKERAAKPRNVVVADALATDVDVWFDPDESEVWEVNAADLSISPVHKAALGKVDPGKGIAQLEGQTASLLLEEASAQSARIAADLQAAGAPADLAERVVRLFELDGAVGLASLGQRLGLDEIELTRAYTHLGQDLGLDWAQAAAARIVSGDPWERLLLAGLTRDFQQQRLEFLGRTGGSDPRAAVRDWLAANGARVTQFKALVDRAKHAAQPNAAMLAQIAGQARVLLGRE